MAFELKTIASAGADFPDVAGWEFSLLPSGTGGKTGQMILDEECPAGSVLNVVNPNQAVILEGSAATRFTSLTYGNGSRIGDATLNGISVETSNIIIQDLQLDASAAARSPVQITTAGTGVILRRCYVRQSGTGATNRCIWTTAVGIAPKLAFCFFETGANALGLHVTARAGVTKYCTILNVDGSTVWSGLDSDGTGLAQAVMVLGAYNSNREFDTTFDAASKNNLGKADASIPGTDPYDLDLSPVHTVADVMPTTDGSDGSRDKTNSAWTDYTADDFTDDDTGAKDVLGNEIDTVAGFRVGAEQPILALRGANPMRLGRFGGRKHMGSGR